VTFLAGLATGVTLLGIVELVLVLWAAGKICSWIEDAS
jgi:hypothetical protein